MLIILRRVPKRRHMSRKHLNRRKSRKCLQRKTIGVKSMRILFELFAVQNKCNNILPMVENYPIYHLRPFLKILITFDARHAADHLMNRLPLVIYQNAPAINSISRKRIPKRPQTLAKNDFNFVFLFF